MQRVSFILLNYNTATLSLAALDSLLKHTPSIEHHQVIVVDNASETADLEALRDGLAQRPILNAELVCSRINGGFGAGHMLGVQQANGDFYVFLNSDLELMMDIVSPALAFFEQQPDAGMLGGQIVDGNGREENSYFNPFGWASEMLGDGVMSRLSPSLFHKPGKCHIDTVAVGSVAGALMIWRAMDFDRLGGFDPNLFLYYEEKDLGLRLSKQLGQKAYFMPALKYVHLGSQSTKPSTAITLEFKRSRIYMTRKHLGQFGYFFLLLRSIPTAALKAIYKPKYRALLGLYLSGGSMSKSMRQQQALRPSLSLKR
jgi:GT2 family glycosyltransferase